MILMDFKIINKIINLVKNMRHSKFKQNKILISNFKILIILVTLVKKIKIINRYLIKNFKGIILI